MKVANDVLQQLPEDIRALVSKPKCFSMRYNFKVALLVPGGLDDCFLVKMAIRDALNETPKLVNGREIYATVERSPHDKPRVAMTAQAKEALNQFGRGGAAFEADWQLFSLHVRESQQECLGGVDGHGKWQWNEDNLRRFFPDLSMDALKQVEIRAGTRARK